MSEISNWGPEPGVIYGKPDPGDPIARAELQEGAAAYNAALTSGPQYVPPSYEAQGTGALPVVGWTAQKDNGTPVFHPYTPTGHIPDWTDDSNPIGAGAYDQNEGIAAFAYDRNNRAPIGGAVFEIQGEPNQNTLPEDVSGTIGDLEW